MGNKIDRSELFMIISQKFILKDFLTINDSDLYCYGNKDICIFKAFNDIYYLIYQTNKYSIISYNIFKKQKICEIKNADKQILEFNHYFDTNNKRDLLLASKDNPFTIKVWNINNFECLLIIDSIFKEYNISFSCFLKDLNNNIFIIVNNGFTKREKIKIYNLEGNIVKEINDSNKYRTSFIFIYYDRKLSNIYIISSNYGCIISYNYNENITKYNKYLYEKMESSYKLDIYDKEAIIKLLGAGHDGRIRIWNFHSGKFLFKIKICDRDIRINDFCFYNDNIIIDCDNGKTKVINIKYGVTIVENLIDKYYKPSFVKIISYNNKEYIISCDKGLYEKPSINLWRINS